MWKTRNGYYFACITAHFFDNSYNYTSLVISFRKFSKRHLSQNIETFIKNELEKLEIESKVRAITTDNANDIKSAASKITYRFPCIAHNLNLIIKNSLKLWGRNVRR